MKEARGKLKQIRDRVFIIAALCGSIADLARNVENTDLANRLEVLAEAASDAVEDATVDISETLTALSA